jgi:hypothetical protein
MMLHNPVDVIVLKHAWLVCMLAVALLVVKSEQLFKTASRDIIIADRSLRNVPNHGLPFAAFSC